MRTTFTRRRYSGIWRGGSPYPPRHGSQDRCCAAGLQTRRAPRVGTTATLLALVLGCQATAGCGLLFLPEVTERPAPALRTVEVVDAVTGDPVTTADLLLARVPWANYMRPYPWVTWGVAQSADGAIRRLAPQADPADVPRSRPARHLGRGWFEIEPHDQWVWHQVVFPFGLPLGPVIHHTRQAHLVVSAPGYRTVWVSDPWRVPAETPPAVRFEFGPAAPAQPGPRVRLTEAGLRMALPPRSLPTRSPRWRRDRPKAPTAKPPNGKPPNGKPPTDKPPNGKPPTDKPPNGGQDGSPRESAPSRDGLRGPAGDS